MKRIVHHLPDLAWEQAARIAHLTLHSTFLADDIETIRERLPQFPPARILSALD